MDGEGFIDTIPVSGGVRFFCFIFLLTKFQVLIIDRGGQKSHLNHQIPAFSGSFFDGTLQIQAGDKNRISHFKIFRIMDDGGLFLLVTELFFQFVHPIAEVGTLGFHLAGIVLTRMLSPGVIFADGFIGHLFGIGDDLQGFFSGIPEHLSPLFFHVILPLLKLKF